MVEIKKAETIKEIRMVCRPDPLNDNNLEAFFVETDKARDPHQKTRQNILDALDNENTRLLFYGHRGCGKSTELNKFIKENHDQFLIVNFSVHQEMSPVAVRAEDLILVIAERVLSAANDAGILINDEKLDKVRYFFSEITQTDKNANDSTIEAGAGIKTDDSFFGKILGLFVQLKAEIKYNVHGEETRVSKLRKRPADLLAYTNILLEAVKNKLPANKRLLVIIEDLDKLDIKMAREIFVNNVSLLTGISASIIYTIPVFLFHSSDLGSFRHSFDDAIPLPMIKTWEPPSTKADAGFEKVKEIVLKRVDEKLIEKAALDYLIENTGGVLRHVFEVLQTTVFMADIEAPIKKEHIEYGLKKLQREFWGQITLPYESIPGGPQKVEDLYDILTEYAIKQKNGEKNQPQSTPANQILLKACALVEYNGEGWFGVHPLVVKNLQTLGRI